MNGCFCNVIIEQIFFFQCSLNNSDMTEEDCRVLTTALNSNPSNLIELNLSGNKFGDSGVTEISTLLGNSQCSLQTLRLGIG